MGGKGSGGRNKRGRPSKFTPELGAEICKLVEVGNYIETAAKACGLNPSTVRDWLKEGIRAKRGRKHDFSVALKKAEGRAQAQALVRIRKAGANAWQADAWFLERKWPDQWGRKERREITGKDGGPVEFRNAAATAKAEIEAALGLYADDDSTTTTTSGS